MISLIKYIFQLKGYRFNNVNCSSNGRIDGKTVVITGGNSGIGKETAIELAKRGGRIIICCRNVEKAKEAVSEIKAKSNSDNVTWYLIDLMSLESVRQCSADLLKNNQRIDILINNAGIMNSSYVKSVDGIESHMAVNHFGPFLLTILLLPKLKQSQNSRIINVCSIVYQLGKIRFDEVNQEAYNADQAYYNSKLAIVLFTQHLAIHLKDTNVGVYCVHPGFVDTKIFRHKINSSTMRFLIPNVVQLIAKNSMQGAQTSIYCAVSEDVIGQSGLYYAECEVEPYEKVSLDNELVQRFWEYSLTVVGLEGWIN